MVMSLATWSCSITPQWPWSVYSQKQMSGITTSSGAARLARRTMRATRPSRFQASLPDGILVVRDAEQHQRLHPVAGQTLDHVLQLALGDA